jgi:hypothetical protein
MGAPADSERRIAMSRNSYRGLTLALILIIGLGTALPTAATGFDEWIPAREPGVLSWIWQWFGNLWTIVGGEGHTVGASETGPLIDPNGGR